MSSRVTGIHPTFGDKTQSSSHGWLMSIRIMAAGSTPGEDTNKFNFRVSLDLTPMGIL